MILVGQPLRFVGFYYGMLTSTDLAGTVQYAELKPKIPESYFPKGLAENASKSTEKPAMNTSRRRSNDTAKTTGRSKKEDEIFDDEDVRDEDLIAAGGNSSVAEVFFC